MAVLIVAFWAATGRAVAMADSTGISLSNATPALGVPVTVTFSTDATESSNDAPWLYAVVQPTAAGACQPTFGDDQQVVGSQATVLEGDYGARVSTGQGSTSANYTTYTAGNYTLCAWLEDTSNDQPNSGTTSADVTATATSSLTSVDTDTVSAAFSTTAPQPKVPFTVTFAGNATPINSNGGGPWLYAVAQPASAGGCQPTFGDDEQVVGSQATTVADGGDSSNQVPTGQYSVPISVTEPRGSYEVCAWLETDSDDQSGSGETASAVMAATGPVALTVGQTITSPPPSTTPSTTEIDQRLKASLAGIGGSGARLGSIHKHSGYSMKFTAPSAGNLTIDWFHPIGVPEILILKGTHKFFKAGSATVRLTLVSQSKARKLVSGSKTLKIVAYATFQPTGGSAVLVKRTFTIRR
jgi:hypothetical protein